MEHTSNEALFIIIPNLTFRFGKKSAFRTCTRGKHFQEDGPNLHSGHRLNNNDNTALYSQFTAGNTAVNSYMILKRCELIIVITI